MCERSALMPENICLSTLVIMCLLLPLSPFVSVLSLDFDALVIFVFKWSLSNRVFLND